MRTTNSTVTFQQAFVLNADCGELPAGSYAIEIDEDEIPAAGLGTVLVSALAKQLNAQIAEHSSRRGLEIVVSRATFQSDVTRSD